MKRWPFVIRNLVLAAFLTVGYLTAASADVVNVDNFAVTQDNSQIFSDSFGAGRTLVGGSGTVLPSGQNFSNGTPANYSVIGTVTETGNKAVLNTALGFPEFFGPPFSATGNFNDVDLQTGPPGSSFSLTPNDSFTTTSLFDLSVPQSITGFFQAELVGNADDVSVQVANCAPGAPPAACGSATSPVIFLRDANFATNTFTILGQAPLDAGNQQILLELSHPTPGTPDIFGSYAYVNGGVTGPFTTLGDYAGLFQSADSAQAGFLNLAFTPEPSSLTLLASSIPSALWLAWLRRRKSTGCRSKIKIRT